MDLGMGIVGWLLLIAACLLLVPTLVLLVEVLAALAVDRPRAPEPLANQVGPIAVLMPAHNEAVGIIASIATVLPQLRASDRLLVVADNCTDSTAAVEIGRAHV